MMGVLSSVNKTPSFCVDSPDNGINPPGFTKLVEGLKMLRELEELHFEREILMVVIARSL